jgi:hypothetical protein
VPVPYAGHRQLCWPHPRSSGSAGGPAVARRPALGRGRVGPALRPSASTRSQSTQTTLIRSVQLVLLTERRLLLGGQGPSRPGGCATTMALPRSTSEPPAGAAAVLGPARGFGFGSSFGSLVGSCQADGLSEGLKWTRLSGDLWATGWSARSPWSWRSSSRRSASSTYGLATGVTGSGQRRLGCEERSRAGPLGTNRRCWRTPHRVLTCQLSLAPAGSQCPPHRDRRPARRSESPSAGGALPTATSGQLSQHAWASELPWAHDLAAGLRLQLVPPPDTHVSGSPTFTSTLSPPPRASPVKVSAPLRDRRVKADGRNTSPSSAIGEPARQLTHLAALLLRAAKGVALLGRQPGLAAAVVVVVMLNATFASPSSTTPTGPPDGSARIDVCLCAPGSVGMAHPLGRGMRCVGWMSWRQCGPPSSAPTSQAP